MGSSSEVLLELIGSIFLLAVVWFILIYATVKIVKLAWTGVW